MAKRGRPPILQNQAIIDKIIENIRLGCFVETSAALAGISKQSFYSWLKLAKEARDKKEKTTLEIQMIEFADRVMVAQAAAEQRFLNDIDLSPDWRAKAWRLEKLFPEKYTERKNIALEGDLKTTSTVKLSEKQLRELGDALVNSPGDISPG